MAKRGLDIGICHSPFQLFQPSSRFNYFKKKNARSTFAERAFSNVLSDCYFLRIA